MLYFEDVVAWYSRLRVPWRKPALLRLVSWAEKLRGNRQHKIATIRSDRVNVRLEVDLDAWLQRELYYHGVFELHTQQCIHALCPAGGVAVDVGANIGTYTVQMSQLVGPSGRVYAFEPTTVFFEKLHRNLSLNNVSNVVVEKAALSDSEGDLVINVLDQTASVALYGDTPGDERERIVATTLDRYAESIDAIDFIKIDVDGWDASVIRGGLEVIQKQRPTMIVECTRDSVAGIDPVEIFEMLDGVGYVVSVDNDPSRKLDRSSFCDLVSGDGSFNAVAVHLDNVEALDTTRRMSVMRKRPV